MPWILHSVFTLHAKYTQHRPIDNDLHIILFTTLINVNKLAHRRLRWFRGSVLAFGTQVRGFKPERSPRIFQGEKNLSTPSFGGEVKPSVPRRGFTACKRSLNVTWKSDFSGKIHRPFLAHVVPPLACRISWRRLVAKVGTFENKRDHKHLHLCR